MQIFHQLISAVHIQHKANMHIKFTQWIKFGVLSFTPKKKQSSGHDDLVMVELKKTKKNNRCVLEREFVEFDFMIQELKFYPVKCER